MSNCYNQFYLEAVDKRTPNAVRTLIDPYSGTISISLYEITVNGCVVARKKTEQGFEFGWILQNGQVSVPCDVVRVRYFNEESE